MKMCAKFLTLSPKLKSEFFLNKNRILGWLKYTILKIWRQIMNLIFFCSELLNQTLDQAQIW